MNPMLDTIERRQRAIAEMGAVAAFHHFIAEAEREGSPSWARQERAALGLLTAKNFAAWERIAPAPGGAA